MSKLVHLPEKIRNKITSVVWGALLGAPDIRLHHTAHVFGAAGIRIGSRFNSGRYLWLDAVQSFNGQTFSSKLTIGNNVNCSELVHIACTTSVTVGDGVLIGSKVLITDHNHGVYNGSGPHSDPAKPPNLRPLTGASVEIGNNVFIGDNVVVLPGSRVGAGAVIAANSVVSGVLAPATMYAGTPAKAIKRFDPAGKQWLRIEAN